jgi:battenin
MMMAGLILAAAGFISVALATVDWLVYLGVVFTALSSGLGEVTLLGYMSFYDK